VRRRLFGAWRREEDPGRSLAARGGGWLGAWRRDKGREWGDARRAESWGPTGWEKMGEMGEKERWGCGDGLSLGEL
jgi:hypothetical protein